MSTAPSARRLLTCAVLPAVVAAAAWHAAPVLSARAARHRTAPRSSGQERPGGVALLFDDGPHPLDTPAVLAALGERDWTATFFLLGSEVHRG